MTARRNARRVPKSSREWVEHFRANEKSEALPREGSRLSEAEREAVVASVQERGAASRSLPAGLPRPGRLRDGQAAVGRHGFEEAAKSGRAGGVHRGVAHGADQRDLRAHTPRRGGARVFCTARCSSARASSSGGITARPCGAADRAFGATGADAGRSSKPPPR